MKKNYKLFFSGLAISTIGALPLGTLNVFAMKISQAKGIAAGFAFSIGVLLIEMIYVFFTLKLFRFLLRKKKAMMVTRWISISIFFLIGISFFFPTHSIFLNSPSSLSFEFPFVTGLVMSAINPVQIPFWMGWNAILIERKILELNIEKGIVWILGIGCGTLLALSFFIMSGPSIVNWLGIESQLLNRLIGCIFLITGFIQLFLNLKKK